MNNLQGNLIFESNGYDDKTNFFAPTDGGASLLGGGDNGGYYGKTSCFRHDFGAA